MEKNNKRMGTMRIVREFTDEGLNEFEDYIEDLNNKEEIKRPSKFNRQPFSKPSGLNVMIDEEKKFDTRLELGKYIDEVFEDAPIGRSELVNRTGVWSWIAWVYLDQLVDDSDEKISTKETAKYICRSSWNRYYRHFISLPYFLVSLHGSENCKIFLECDVDIHKDTVEQLVSKRAIVTNKTIISTANSIYWDEGDYKVKRGAASRDAPGTIRRFRTVVNQFRRTFDIHNMNPEEFERLLPKEFDKWIEEGFEEPGDSDEKDSEHEESEDESSRSIRDRLGF
jgi:hypothetical protein